MNIVIGYGQDIQSIWKTENVRVVCAHRVDITMHLWKFDGQNSPIALPSCSCFNELQNSLTIP